MGRLSKIIQKAVDVLIKKEPVAPVVDKLEDPVCTVGPGQFSHGYSPYKGIKSEPYTGVPAPAYLQEDPWFGTVPEYTEKQRDYMEMEFEMKKREDQQRKETTKEPENIHEVMYQKATKNQNTTVQLNPPGGSENFHEGPGGWNSGTGINQFR